MKLRIPTVLGLIVMLGSFAAMSIWLFIPELKEFSGGSMKFNTTIGLFLSSVILVGVDQKFISQKVHRILAGFILFIGVYTTLEYLVDLPGNIDQLIVTDFANAESSLFPGRMSPFAAALFIFTGLGFFLKSFPHLEATGFAFFIPVYFFSFISLIGYIYGQKTFYQLGDFIRISWQSALCFHLIAIGVFFRRHRHVTSFLTSRGPGGMIARRLLPTVVIMPIILGYLWKVAREKEIVTREMGISLFVVLVISILIVVISFIAKKLDSVEEARKGIEGDFTKVLDTSPLSIWVLNSEGIFTVCQGAALAKIGVTSEDFIGKNFYTVNEKNPHLIGLVKRAFNGEAFTEENTFDGHFYSTNFSPVRDTNNKITGITAISLDITDLKRAESAAIMEQKNLRHFFTQTPELFGILRAKDLVYEFANEGLMNFYGFDPTGMPLRKVRPEAEFAIPMMESIIRTGETIVQKEVHTVVNNEDRFVNLTWAAKRNEAGLIDGIMFLGLDITEQVRARMELKKAVSARDEFLSVASHELKTPITSFLLQLQVMDRLRKKNDAKAYEEARVNQLVDLGTKQLNRINRLVEDMLDISRINSGKLSFRFEMNSLTETVTEVVTRMKLIFDAEQTDLVYTSTPDLTLKMDRVRIEQVITNTLSNALRYGEKKPVHIDLKPEDNFIVITVKDYGRGIPKEDLQRIFGRFERGIDSNEISGLGLGLYISREIVEAHGGTITASSDGPGKGTLIRILLPAKK